MIFEKQKELPMTKLSGIVDEVMQAEAEIFYNFYLNMLFYNILNELRIIKINIRVQNIHLLIGNPRTRTMKINNSDNYNVDRFL